jgi:hypothetical protein
LELYEKNAIAKGGISHSIVSNVIFSSVSKQISNTIYCAYVRWVLLGKFKLEIRKNKKT